MLIAAPWQSAWDFSTSSIRITTKGGTPRHDYDMVMALIATGKVDVETFYETVPYAEIDRLPAFFPNYQERHMKVALEVPPQ